MSTFFGVYRPFTMEDRPRVHQTLVTKVADTSIPVTTLLRTGDNDAKWAVDVERGISLPPTAGLPNSSLRIFTGVIVFTVALLILIGVSVYATME